MERTINKVELRGNVGADPIITTIDGGVRLIRFSLATHEAYKGRDGQFKEETMWHNVVAWIGKNGSDFEGLKKGAFVSVVGKIKYSRYTSKEGQERFSTDIVALNMNVLNE